MATKKNPATPALRYIPLSQWDQHFAWPTVSALRWLVYNARSNGLEKANAIRRVGKRVLINPENFHAWVDSNPTGTGGVS